MHERLRAHGNRRREHSGELEVSEDGQSSQVAVRLHTEMDEQAIEGDLQRTLDNIKRLVEDGAGA